MANIINGRGRVGVRQPSGNNGTTTTTTSSGPSYLLDTYGGAAAAYSLRKLNSSYSGPAIRVRRSSDNTEQNIGFDGNGNLNESALTTFVGANNGFVTTWYDQSGNDRNAIQINAGSQPLIVSGGVLLTINSKPVINNYQINISRPLISSLSYIQDLPVTVIFAGKINTMPAAGNPTFYIGGPTTIGGGGRYELAASESGNGYYATRRTDTGADFTFVTPFNTNAFVHQGIFRTSEITTRRNGIDAATPGTYSGTGNSTNGNFHILATGQAGFASNISAFECIIYFSDQYTNRTGIESNINSYYSIY